MRRVMIGLASASAIVAMLSPVPASAQSFVAKPEFAKSAVRGSNARSMYRMRSSARVERDAPEPASRDAVPPDLDQRRRDGHMTPEERRLLRQHIEDAVRELYRR